MTEQTAPEKTPRRRLIRRPKGPLGWFLSLMIALVLIVAAVGVATRFIIQTPRALLLIEARADGLKLGRIGKLRIEGLHGDVLRNFTVDRLTISDEKGVWLEADHLAIQWNYLQLLRRKLDASLVTAEDTHVFRRPILTPKEKDQQLPVSFDIDSLKTRLRTEPEFSIRKGDFDVAAGFDIERRGGGQGALQAASRLHLGDGINAKFTYGKRLGLSVDAHAIESEGGAIAGALGLPEDKRFTLDAKIGDQDDGSGGEINIFARTGEDTPLAVEGAWGEEGLSATGRLDLTASSLTLDQVSRFGPELRFTAMADPARDEGIYDLKAEGTAENLHFAVAGPVRAADRSLPSGLSAEAAVQDVSRIVDTPTIGPASFKGQILGDLTDLTLKGQAQADGFELGGFTAGRVYGPVSVRHAKRQWTIAADLKASGGGGEGVLAGLMGSTPAAAAELTRLEDGRLLIRSMEIHGAGIDAKGAGGRMPITGALSFDGQARLFDLARVREGAAGEVSGSWSANRGGSERPWSFTAKAKAANFATGMAELDRLLGAEPSFEASADLKDGGWRIEKASLDGKAGQVDAKGVFGPQNALDLTLDWRANGPFHAGPVEISGKIAGDGTLTGTLMNPRASLMADIGGIDVGRLALENAHLALTFASGDDGSNGSIDLKAASAQGPAAARSNFRFVDGGIYLSDLDANAGGITAKGELALQNGRPSRADLALTARQGAFLSSGLAQGRVQITDAPGGAQADMSMKVTNLQMIDSPFTVETGQLTARGPLDRLPYTLQATGSRGDLPLSLDGSGVASYADQGYRLTFNGKGRVNTVRFNTLQPLEVEFGGPELSATGLIAVGGGRAQIEARQKDDQVRLQAAMSGIDLNVLSRDLAGRFDASLTATGQADRLTGQLTASLENARSRDGPTDSAIDGVLHAQLQDSRLSVTAQATNEVGLRSSANVVLPVVATAAPLRLAIERTKPIEGAFDIDGELRPIWDLFFGGARTLGGRLTAQGTLAGTFNDPRVNGQAKLENGALEDFATGLKLKDVTFQADLRTDAISVNQFSARDEGRGTLTGEGRIDLKGGSSSFTIKADHFLLIDNDLAQAQATGTATISRGADAKSTLKGDLTIDRADVKADLPTPSNVVPMDVIEINVPPERADYFDAPHGRGPAIGLDVSLSAPRRVFLRGRGLDVELSLNAHVGGTTSSPSLSGTARVVRGEYDFAGKRFELSDEGVVYLASNPENIRIDLTAIRDDPTLTAQIDITGTAAKPEIKLSSTPALPDDEILSQVLFGASASQLSPIEAAQLASSLGALASGGGFDVIGGLRNFAGLDRLAFGGGDASGLTVSGGKYISDDVYLELTGGGREGGSAQVEWRVRKNLSIVSRVAGSGDTRLSIRWRKTYGTEERPNAD